jgi:hypothetical protein
MKGGFMKILLVVLVVAGVSAVCVYTMALSSSHIEQEESEHTRQADSRSPRSPETAQLLDTGPGKAPPGETASSKQPDQAQPGPEQAPVEQKPVPEPASDEGFDPLLGEQFDEAAIARGSPNIRVIGRTPEEAIKNRDIERIDRQVEKMRKGLTKKANTIASKMKLDQALKEDLLAISLEGLSEVADIRKQFAGRAMTDSDRAYARDQMKAANANTTENIRRLLGDEKFKEFRKETRYFDNPSARVLDKMKGIEKQNRDLQRKIDQQNRRKKKRKSGGMLPRNWRPR